MRMITPITIDNDVLDSSNVSEDDYDEWSASTTYAAEDRVIVTGTTHKIYESAQGSNTGNDPTTDDGTWWIEVSATNRWKAFDAKLADQTTNTGSIEYVLVMPSNVTGIAIFNPEGESLDIVVESGSTEIFSQNYPLVNLDDITDWLEYFTTDLSSEFVNPLVINVPAYTNNVVTITINGASASSTVKVGEIVLGAVTKLGDTQYGTSVSILDFSTKEQDTFGNYTIVERTFQDEVNFNFYLPTETVGKVKKKLASRRARPTVYFDQFEQSQYGTIAYGFYEDFDIPLSGPSLSFATLEVRGLS